MPTRRPACAKERARGRPTWPQPPTTPRSRWEFAFGCRSALSLTCRKWLRPEGSGRRTPAPVLRRGRGAPGPSGPAENELVSPPRFVNLGCRTNAAETDEVAALLKDATDVVVVNSCTVTLAADRDTRKAVHRARREQPAAALVLM